MLRVGTRKRKILKESSTMSALILDIFEIFAQIVCGPKEMP
jgi:hypothetical protein